MRYLYPIIIVIIVIVAAYILQTMVGLPEPFGTLLYYLYVILAIILVALIIWQIFLLVTKKDTLSV